MLIAGAIYALLAYLVVPLIRKHRSRYSEYMPADGGAEDSSGLRARVGRTLAAWVVPPLRRARWRRGVVDGSSSSGRESSSGDELAFGEEEGESMVGFDVARRDRSIRGGNVEIDSSRRLSRDLEEGFKDDSEDGEESGDDGRR